MKTLRLYVLRELAAPFVLSMAFFTVMLMVVKLLDLSEELLEAGVSAATFGELMVIVIGTMLTLTIPMAVLLATLIGVGRLKAENELLAMRVAGISLVPVFVPVLVAALLVSGVLMWTNSFAVPRMFQRVETMIAQIQFNVINNLRPGIFYDDFGPDGGDLTLYFEENLGPATAEDAGAGIRMGGVNIRMKVRRDQILPEDAPPEQRRGRAEFLIFADEGELRVTGTGMRRTVTLELANGTWIPLDDRAGDATTTVSFGRMEYSFDIGGEDEFDEDDSPPQMTTPELLARLAETPAVPVLDDRRADDPEDRIAEPWRAWFALRNELIQRFTLPLATLAFVLIAIPLGMEFRPRARALALLMAVGLMVIYYMLNILGGSIGSSGAGWPVTVLAFMFPNLLLGLIGAFLFWREVRR